ncbi:hypothetical protein BJV82DRAFT_584176 [Fennellomyces sp. T-0311]|nr:hypothetical protein BJV82DRAFT_584176 [Fennellomyces sp. T-0311]
MNSGNNEETLARRIQELEAQAERLQIRLNEREHQTDTTFPGLPQEIIQELEEASYPELEESFRVFRRDITRYDGGIWTRQGAVNKIYIGELKKARVEAFGTVQAKYKDAERLRGAARAASDIFQAIQHILTRGGSDEDEEDLHQVMEKARRLAVYGFATSKQQDREA